MVLEETVDARLTIPGERFKPILDAIPNPSKGDQEHSLCNDSAVHAGDADVPLNVQREIDIVRVSPFSQWIAGHDLLEKVVEPDDSMKTGIKLQDLDGIIQISKGKTFRVPIQVQFLDLAQL